MLIARARTKTNIMHLSLIADNLNVLKKMDYWPLAYFAVLLLNAVKCWYFKNETRRDRVLKLRPNSTVAQKAFEGKRGPFQS